MSSAQNFVNDGPQIDAVVRDSIFNWAGVLISGILNLLIVPFLLSGLGSETFSLWIAALAVVGILMFFDFGLEWTIPSCIAGKEKDESLQEFLASAAGIYLLIGLAGALIIGLAGVPLSILLGYSSGSFPTSASTFVLAGLIFLTLQPLKFINAVLTGFRRFDASNSVTAASSFFRTTGMFLALKLQTGIEGVAVGYILGNMTAIVLAYRIAGKRQIIRFRLRFWDWKAIRPHLTFGLSSQANALLTRLLWESAPLLIGLIAGPSTVVSYYVAQRFPFALSLLHDRVGNAIFPAAAQIRNDVEASKRILSAGTRWIVLFTLPISILLLLLAPQILQLWIGSTDHTTLAVFRILTLAIFFDSAGAASLHLIWGQGNAQKITKILAVSTSLYLIAGVIMLWKFGITGLAISFLAAIVVCSLAYINYSTLVCRISSLRLIVNSAGPLILPSLFFTLAIGFSQRYVSNFPVKLLCILASALIYGAMIYARMDADEKVRFHRLYSRSRSELS